MINFFNKIEKKWLIRKRDIINRKKCEIFGYFWKKAANNVVKIHVAPAWTWKASRLKTSFKNILSKIDDFIKFLQYALLFQENWNVKGVLRYTRPFHLVTAPHSNYVFKFISQPQFNQRLIIHCSSKINSQQTSTIVFPPKLT